jgi:hypothetical protein
MITLFHGSFLSVEKPLVGVGRHELDFGPGFYVTPLYEQAERWARRVCIIRAVDTPLRHISLTIRLCRSALVILCLSSMTLIGLNLLLIAVEG